MGKTSVRLCQESFESASIKKEYAYANAACLSTWGAAPLCETNYNVKASPELHKAAYCGDLEIAAFLIEHRASPINQKNNEGWAPLHYAAMQKDYEMAKLLLQHGADPNIVGGGIGVGKTTPLGIEMQDYYTDTRVIEVLIAYGAEISPHMNREWGGIYAHLIDVWEKRDEYYEKYHLHSEEL